MKHTKPTSPSRLSGSKLLLLSVALVASLPIGCDGGGLPGGLRETPDGTGPMVRWDVGARPLPEVPLPNDTATWPDPTSPTGRRVNASFVAPTALESSIRTLFGTLDGWGTYQPITVGFEAPLDLQALLDAQGGDAYSESQWQGHAIYLVNLTTGLPVPLDVNGGNFHYGLASTGSYYANDPRALEATLLFETVEEDVDGDGFMDPGEDTDFDGVLDHPNTIDGLPGATPEETHDRMAWFYERETDTLFLRPVLPLEERTEYAVVLTDRLVGEDGAPVRSPFPYVHHVSQIESLAELPDRLAEHPELYGDLATRGWNGVAFAWTFTTGTVTTDLVELRDGLYGRGPYAFLADEFPAEFHAAPLRGAGRGGTCPDIGSQIYTVTMDQFREILAQLANEAFGLSEEDVNLLLGTFDNVSHFVFGFYESPYLLGDPNVPSVEASFDLDALAEDHTVGRDLIPVVMVVPLESPEHQQPFPVAFYGHGHTSVNLEGLGFAGMMARNGIATVAIDAEGHGFALDRGLRTLVEAVFATNCATPWGRVVSIDRSRDLDGDDVPDSGGNFWSAYLFHTRDVVRQSVLDHVQLLRILRHFGGGAPGGPVAASPFTLHPLTGAEIVATGDYDGDGTSDPDMGDFDTNGRPDIGGWEGDYAAWGQSLGGFLSVILASIDPAIRTAAPTSGAAGLPDVGFRSQLGGVRNAVVLRLLGPLVVAEPNTTGPGEDSACAAGEASLQWIVPSVDDRVETEFACLDEEELREGDAVVVRNLTTGEVRCSGVLAEARFRVSIPADAGDTTQVEVYRDGLLRMDYATCEYREDGGEMPDPVRVVSTWESTYGTRSAPGTCERCGTYQATHYDVDTDLVSPTEGFGTARQTPGLRRFFALTQAGLEAGDPVNYVRHIFLDPIRAEDWTSTAPRSLLVTSSIGDDSVPIAAGYAMARVAGLLPFMPADAPDVFADFRAPSDFEATYGARSPNALLNAFHVLEGIPRFHRHPVGVTTDFLVDADDLSLGRQLFLESGDPGGTIAPVAISPPLRWTRASRAVVDGDTDSVFDPPLGSYDGLSGVLGLYVAPFGNHGSEVPSTVKTWDEGIYYPQMISRWYFTDGEDLRYHTDPTGHVCLEDSSCDFLVGPTP